MKKFHIKARQHWEKFTYDGKEFCLKHLSVHEVKFKGNKRDFNFVVTYGLHCFAKDGQEYSLDFNYSDSFETRQVNLERYHLSKDLRGFIEALDSYSLLYETTKEKYFTFEHTNNLKGVRELCKICICVFKENRLLRLHVTSAFFDKDHKETKKSGVSIFKIAKDTVDKKKSFNIPKEATRK